ncbi:MAG: hypothetical protein ABJA16_08940, partial [Nakamurella sp.]
RSSSAASAPGGPAGAWPAEGEWPLVESGVTGVSPRCGPGFWEDQIGVPVATPDVLHRRHEL